MKHFAFFIVLCLAILSSCKAPDVKPNVKTTVSGRFYDAVNKEAYANLKVKVGEYQLAQKYPDPAQYYLVDYRDSTTTDVNGNYKLTFTTTGNGSSYFLEFKGIPSYASVSPISAGGDGAYSWKSIDNIGAANVYNFNVDKTYYMKIRVIVQNNALPPLYVYTGNAKAPNNTPGKTVYGKNNDTVKYIPIIKNTGGFYLYFATYNPKKYIFYHNTLIPLNPVINADTIQGATYTLSPGNFK